MYGTNSRTNTYTILDIKKTFEGFETDLRTIARRTNKWTMAYVDDIFHDILVLAEKELLRTVDIVLLENNSEKVLRASKFQVNSLGRGIKSDRAGKNNDWVDIPNSHLSILITRNQKWTNLSNEAKLEIRRNLKISWSPSTIDNNFSHLKKSNAQLYASTGYELQKNNYK